MSRRYFGTDGIRGRVNTNAMNPALAMRVGMAAGRRFGAGKRKRRVVIGKDTRLSGYMLEAALVSGFTAAGMDEQKDVPVIGDHGGLFTGHGYGVVISADDSTGGTVIAYIVTPE